MSERERGAGLLALAPAGLSEEWAVSERERGATRAGLLALAPPGLSEERAQ